MGVQRDPAYLKPLQWRLIGPFRGGRSVAVAGHPTRPTLFYFGSTGGGVWKTEDAGTTWQNISDGFFKTASVGAIAVAESDPNVIYVGMGETTIRGNVTHGDGLYKSTDGGKSWVHLGLKESRQIAKVRIHPRNPDILYVAAFGHVFGPNKERGIYRSTDGGKSFEQLLFRSEKAGAIDLSMDPTNPRILYASFWEAYRTPYSLESGGPGSSLYKSTDGGDTWVELTDNPGLPRGLKGKIGVAVSPARPDRVWAIVEAKEGGLFRSDDAGATWTLLNSSQDLLQRPWYYCHIFADPMDPETVYIPSVQFWRSIDGGKTFHTRPVPHGDNHELWIDPKNPQRMILGNDGGATVSLTGGDSWTTQYNQPTAELYHVTTDNHFPYRVYGAQQDNMTIAVASRSDKGAITPSDYYMVGGGESGYIAVRPDNANIVYAGSYDGLLTRYDHTTKRSRDISVWPDNPMGWAAGDLKYRFQWTFPILLSPHDPNVLYAAGNHLFKSTNEGESWEEISPDLTRNDPTKLGPSGGPLSKDNTSVEYYGTIFAVAESPVTPGLLWTGSDDGLIHLSRDHGQTWTNVTPANLPEWSLISIIEASPHQPGTAYVAANRYKLDDLRPYLYKTEDYGESWELIVEGIPAESFARVIREDVEVPGLLYAGTETGVFVSFDKGAHWQPLQQNLPTVPVHDLQVKGDDLVAGTHGRSFWILDDLTPLRQLTESVTQAPVHLFQPRPTYRVNMGVFRFWKEDGPKEYLWAGGFYVTGQPRPDGTSRMLDAGENPPDGVAVTYYLREKPEGEVKLRFLDSEGRLIKEFTSKPKPKSADPHAKAAPAIPAEAGANRFSWNMRYPDATEVPGAIMWAASLAGPVALPGTYQVELIVGGESHRQPFQIIPDPRVSVSDEALREQFAFLIQVREKLSQTHEAVNQIRSVKEQIQFWVDKAKESPVLAESGQALSAKLSAIEEQLLQVRSKTHEDPLNYPVLLNNKLASLSSAAASAEGAPTKQVRAVYAELAQQIDGHLADLQRLVSEELPAFSQAVQGANLQSFTLPTQG